MQKGFFKSKREIKQRIKFYEEQLQQVQRKIKKAESKIDENRFASLNTEESTAEIFKKQAKEGILKIKKVD